MLHEPACGLRVAGSEGDPGVVEGIAADLRVLSNRPLARRPGSRYVDVLQGDPGKAHLPVQRMERKGVTIVRGLPDQAP